MSKWPGSSLKHLSKDLNPIQENRPLLIWLFSQKALTLDTLGFSFKHQFQRERYTQNTVDMYLKLGLQLL